MKFTLSPKYFWKNMYEDIDQFVDNCNIYQKLGGPRINTRNKIINTRHVNELWEIDLIGCIKNQERKLNTYMLCRPL
ncbi:hypothetical protein COBT_001914 [Conglomerata obtusa]